MFGLFFRINTLISIFINMNKELLLRLVEKFGIWDAAKMVGLSITEILTITKYPLYPMESYEVLLDLISNEEIPTKYK